MQPENVASASDGQASDSRPQASTSSDGQAYKTNIRLDLTDQECHNWRQLQKKASYEAA